MKKDDMIIKFVKDFMKQSIFEFIESCLMKEDKKLIINSITNKLNEDQKEYLIQKTKDLTSFRDMRSPIDYCKNIIRSWIIEECIKKTISKWGIKILNYGTDNEREILVNSYKIKNDPDILIETNSNEFKKVEIIQSYTNHSYRNKEIILRFNKFHQLKQEDSYVLFLSFSTQHFLLFNINEIKKKERIDSFEPFGGKQVFKIDISHLSFIPFRFFKKELFSKFINEYKEKKKSRKTSLNDLDFNVDDLF